MYFHVSFVRAKYALNNKLREQKEESQTGSERGRAGSRSKNRKTKINIKIWLSKDGKSKITHWQKCQTLAGLVSNGMDSFGDLK